MKSIGRRIVFLVAFFDATVFGYGCASLTPKGDVLDKPGLAEASVIVWRDVYGRTDASPLVRFVTGAGLTCTEDVGTAGFDCFGACRSGCTITPTTVSIVWPDGMTWARSLLAHEMLHAAKMRAGIANLAQSPTAELLQALSDSKHEGPDWKAGGVLERANAELERRGL